MIGLLYFFIIVIANTVGALSGMGGGVLIKPAFDMIGADSVATISFYSTVAVFIMSFVSTTKHLRSGERLEWKKILTLAIGSIIGGTLGNTCFELALHFFRKEETVVIVQILLTIFTLLFAFLYTKSKKKSFNFKGTVWFVLGGSILGFLASFLGIGGGPINVAILMLLFGMPIKQSTIYSICIIFFSQLAKILSIILLVGLERYNLTTLIYIIPAAVIGGLIGAKLNRVLSPKKVTIAFQWVLVIVLLINLYNLFTFLK